ncbi:MULTISPECIES: UTP--glucose-1-phosphate uridylyltransferase GalU [unclassified Agarivorans]|uniref:UTP--glucose-1-phosphate uridylyltransferase GalU n=1 Tax=unclassified Agarivorans TaxID=2636026 RepID=UPI0010F6409F|nr:MULTISPECIES: UTP--glucose-1-phosphate uridylyltransferase GalU [unclassified Agarivorans]MDO6764679.1 UTP--glucose-1-phosphate uridylyltransferase GalU [Agarivorans sp. 1_MG-2023]
MIKKCLFPVAGYGTRFLPATKSMPKEMLPIVNKPLVQYGVEEAVAADMSDMAFITGRGKRAIADHFDISYELENEIAGTSKEEYLKEIRHLVDNVNCTYTRQKKMMGLGHAVLCGETLIGQEPFGVVLADDLCFGDDGGVLAQMTKLYEQFRCSIIAVMEVPLEEAHKYGVIEGEALRDDLFRVTSMVEKPAKGEEPSNLAVIGRYILTPDIFSLIRDTKPGKNGEIQLTDALLTQAQNGCVMAYKFKGKRFDCGSVEGFVEATNYCFENLYGK